METLTLALAQLAAGTSLCENCDRVLAAIREAKVAGADLVLLPEAALLPFGVERPQAFPCPDAARRIVICAEETKIVACVGLFLPAHAGKVFNTLLVAGQGLFGVYHKRYLFDAYHTRESATTCPGERPVLLTLPPFALGLALCYDIRFPEHFITLAQAGATAFLVAADWARGEGKLAQWRLLAQARALDTTSWLLACGQAASPENPGFGLGHSLLVAPDGTIVQELGEDEGMLVATLDIANVHATRAHLPVLAHQRTSRSPRILSPKDTSCSVQTSKNSALA